MKKFRKIRNYLKYVFCEIHHDELAGGSWETLIAITLLGVAMVSLFGYLLLGLFHEHGNIIPPIIFSGLMTMGGFMFLLGGIIEGCKKFLYQFFPKRTIFRVIQG